jgi:hypothetical protein
MLLSKKNSTSLAKLPAFNPENPSSNLPGIN